MKRNLGWNTWALRFLLVAAAMGLFPACAKLPRKISAGKQQSTASPAAHVTAINTKQININTASAAELERLPGVGKVLAARIVAHRENYGPFRRLEELIIVRGISDRKFREMRALITTE
jgi:competence protein ComEA